MPQQSIRYPIPAKTTRIEFEIARSRFITTITEAQTVKAARAFIKEIGHEFSDASHNVFAFRVGYGGTVTEGASDDGEPSGTAGRPALTVLRGADLGDVALVITRYYGGMTLGTGGLVRAYTESVQEVLLALPRTERVAEITGLLALPYAIYEQVKRLIAAHQGRIDSEDFAADITLTLIFALDTREGFEIALTELSSGKLEVLWFEEE